MEIRFMAALGNESFARTAVASFVSILNPTIDEIEEIKTIVSEAVSNAIIHGYELNENKSVYINVDINGFEVTITVQDYGKGIEDINKINYQQYAVKEGTEHAGMGITIMKSFSDYFDIKSKQGIGTKVTLKKNIEQERVIV